MMPLRSHSSIACVTSASVWPTMVAIWETGVRASRSRILRIRFTGIGPPVVKGKSKLPSSITGMRAAGQIRPQPHAHSVVTAFDAKARNERKREEERTDYQETRRAGKERLPTAWLLHR